MPHLFLVQPVFTSLPEFNMHDYVGNMREHIPQLHKALHFEEVQFDPKEQWILKLNVDA
jgi:hypothetical protein